MSSYGGKRPGSGRKTPTSPYGEPTEVIRVPKSALPEVVDYLEAVKRIRKRGGIENMPEMIRPADQPSLVMRPSLIPEASARPIYSWKIVAGETTGFKSPAQDYEQEELDLNKRYVVNKPATFFFQVGKHYDSMVDAGIQPGSVIIVDCSLKPKHTSIVVAAVDDEWVVKRLYKRSDKIKLLSENKEKSYPPIEFNDGQELLIFGVARTAINDIL